MFSQGRFKTGPQKSSRPTTGKKAPPPKTHISSIEQDNIQQLIEQLIVNQKECQKNGQYVEAETFKRKIKILREQADQNELAEMKNKHVKERQQIQQAHLEELNCFNIEWDQRIVSLNSQIEKMEEELTLKQAAEIKQIEDQMMSDKPHKFKESGTLLNLRRIQMELAKQQNYMEARQVQIKAQKLQKEELEKWRKNQTSKCKNSLNVLKNKHENELKVLQQRIQLTIQEKNRQRMQQEQKIVLKYQNVIRELEFQQKQEIQRLQKSNKLASLHTKTKAGLLSTSKASFR